MKNIIFSILLFILINIPSFAQIYKSYLTLMPVIKYENESKITDIIITSAAITIKNATYQDEILNLRIDSILNKEWDSYTGYIKTYYCTDIDINKSPKVFLLDLLEKQQTFKLIYVWDEITIEEHLFCIIK
jgi:hypothetical protein